MLILVATSVPAQESDTTMARSAGREAASSSPRFLPSGDWYEPSLADPREPRFHQGVVRITGGSVASRVWLADHGETIGIIRWSNPRFTGGVQIGVLVAKFAQFDLLTESNDLVNADYMIGVPLSFRHGRLMGRVSLYHVSSHLGDEYLQRTNVERVNVSYETFDARVGYERGNQRLYGGVETAIRRFPSDLLIAAAHLGAEARLRAVGLDIPGNARVYPVISADVGAPAARDGGASVSVKAGLELSTPGSFAQGARRLHILGEYYSGQSRFGQFYHERIRYAGLAMQLTI